MRAGPGTPGTTRRLLGPGLAPGSVGPPRGATALVRRPPMRIPHPRGARRSPSRESHTVVSNESPTTASLSPGLNGVRTRPRFQSWLAGNSRSTCPPTAARRHRLEPDRRPPRPARSRCPSLRRRRRGGRPAVPTWSKGTHSDQGAMASASVTGSRMDPKRRASGYYVLIRGARRHEVRNEKRSSVDEGKRLSCGRLRRHGTRTIVSPSRVASRWIWWRTYAALSPPPLLDAADVPTGS